MQRNPGMRIRYFFSTDPDPTQLMYDVTTIDLIGLSWKITDKNKDHFTRAHLVMLRSFFPDPDPTQLVRYTGLENVLL